MTLSNTDGQIKAAPRSESGMSQADCANAVDKMVAAIAKLPIPPTAKYVGTIMVTMRLIDSKAIAEFTGIPLRSVQRAMMQVSASGVIGATGGAPVASSTPPVAPEQVSRVHARAQIESPSGIDSSQEVASKAREAVPGLGDLGEVYADWLAGWLKGDHGIKDHETARAILAGSVDAYAPDKVKAGMLELKARIAGGEKFRDLGRMFSSYVKNAKLARAETAPKKTLRQVLDEAKAAREAGVAA